jgi:flagellar M-ring protein FliF
MEKGRRTRLIILASLIVLIIIVATVLLNHKSYSVLYSGMNPKEAGEVLAALSEKNVSAKVQGNDTVLVESSQVDSVRMQLAAEGYPKSGFNFDIFKNASGLGTTDMEKRVYLQFQYQDNLRRTIVKMDKVDDAVVNVNLSEESPFVLAEDTKPATASVMLILKEGYKIDKPEVRTITELVSKSIPGLKSENVRIVDSKMNLYTLDDNDELENLGTQLQLQQNVQTRLKNQITNLLTPVFGKDRVIAEVNVVLNFDKQVTESKVFTPPVEGAGNQGIVISMKELSETIKNNVTPSDDNESGTPQYPSADGDDDLYEKVSKESNMELNETKTLIENAKGQIKDLSVSVILDSSDSQDDYKDNVRQLVANAIGVGNDKITVEMLPFRKMDNSQVTDLFSNQNQLLTNIQKAETTKYIIISVAAFVVLLLLLAIVRSFTRKDIYDEYYEGYEEYEEYDEEQSKVANGKGVDIVADEEIVPPPLEEKELQFAEKDTTLKELGKYIDKSPEAVAQLLRRWLYDDF